MAGCKAQKIAISPMLIAQSNALICLLTKSEHEVERVSVWSTSEIRQISQLTVLGFQKHNSRDLDILSGEHEAERVSVWSVSGIKPIVG